MQTSGHIRKLNCEITYYSDLKEYLLHELNCQGNFPDLIKQKDAFQMRCIMQLMYPNHCPLTSMPAAKIQMREEEDRIDKKVKSIKSDPQIPNLH